MYRIVVRRSSCDMWVDLCGLHHRNMPLCIHRVIYYKFVTAQPTCRWSAEWPGHHMIILYRPQVEEGGWLLYDYVYLIFFRCYLGICLIYVPTLIPKSNIFFDVGWDHIGPRLGRAQGNCPPDCLLRWIFVLVRRSSIHIRVFGMGP